VAERWEELIGKHVLAGMTYLDNEENVIEQRQIHGTIISASDEAVWVEVAGSDEPQWLPPHLVAYEEADEGEYRLRSTGEVVIDPDFLCTWTIHPGPGR
jgi:hypothetical protein